METTGGYRGHDRDCMVVGFITTIAISAYHRLSCEFESSSWRGVLDTTLCDKICLWLAADRWFSTGTQVSSTNTTVCHDITEILLKVVLNTLTLTHKYCRNRFKIVGKDKINTSIPNTQIYHSPNKSVMEQT